MQRYSLSLLCCLFLYFARVPWPTTLDFYFVQWYAEDGHGRPLLPFVLVLIALYRGGGDGCPKVTIFIIFIFYFFRRTSRRGLGGSSPPLTIDIELYRQHK